MKKLSTILLFIIIIINSSYSYNSIIIKEINGDSTQYYPVQFARPFAKGEILNYPQAVINSQPIFTQADVKCRWEDGSVKHSVITFYLPILNPYDSIKVNFINQETGNNESYLQIDLMLSDFFDFEAEMNFINDLDTIRVSAREMLGNNHLQYWLKGALCTSVILADHSRERQYDFGFNQAGGTDTLNRSIRPLYHITFFPLINKIKIRYIAEISNSERIQDQTYSLILKAGNTNPEQMYSKSQFIHHGLSRWTKEYWLGEPLPKI
ncbi:MAG TPA: hypothetical protein PK762_11550, partial [Candidatus Kapabacteria bacterium]|nr:hypothetical protein [Candidatus Kapabacteria bacterium]